MQSLQHIYDENHDMNEKKRQILFCIAKGNMLRQLNDPSWFLNPIFQLRQWALELYQVKDQARRSQRWYLDQKPVSYRWNLCQESSL